MPKTPVKPFGVPATAAWAAGSTAQSIQGVWVDCWKTEAAIDRFDCTVYTVDAKPHAKGRYQLVGGDPKEPIRYQAWDGKTLAVDGGRTLAPESCVERGIVRCR